MSKIASKLDWNRMLGFDQVADTRAGLDVNGTKLGARVGEKIGVKLGGKVGVKLGVKLGIKA